MKKKLNCVLLVDDDEGNNFLNKIVIEDAGIAERIETVLNGKEALDFLTNSGKFAESTEKYPQPVLILLDINMPVMDGWEFMREYEKLDENQKGKIIIVMLTTSFNPDDRVAAENNVEISDFRNKPLSEVDLKDIMEKFFPEYL